MKKIVLAFFLLAAVASQAQTNLQVHYDFGKDRQYVTTTLEMFKADKVGNTFFFVDLDYNYGENNSPSLAYMEIARCLNFWGGPFSAHVEYNGGFGVINSSIPYEINNAWLIGLDYGIHNADFSKTFNLKALFKNIQGKNNSPQFTGVWGLHFYDRKLTFSGFADLWWEKNTYANSGSDANAVFLTEPQLWYNITPHFSTGGEVEIASNFAGEKGFTVCPTLAVKWNF
ncbi:MAG: DUF5020 family protein [Bacteroidales bacterium]|nr:DUF5020 family protein [Bacteroidales bacterium]